MIVKGYDHPLYTLNLIQPSDPSDDEPRFFVPVPEGRLVVRREQRERGGRLRHEVCGRALTAGLTFRERDPAGFTEHGFDPAWVGNIQHWWGRLCDFQGQRQDAGEEGAAATGQRRELMNRTRGAWRRLSICAGLAGLFGQVVNGPAPRSRPALLEALTHVVPRAQAHKALLASFGFGPARLDDLRRTTEALAALHQDASQRGWDTSQLGAMQAVLRGAIIGDLSRLVQSAQLVLPGDKGRGCTMQDLLGKKPSRRTRNGLKAAPAQATSPTLPSPTPPQTAPSVATPPVPPAP